MINILSWLIATIVTVPILSVLLIYFISMKITKNKKKSFQRSLDYSTLFFIFSVYYLTYAIWDQSFLWVILLILILIAMLFVFLQWKVKQEIEFRRAFKGFWRFNFLLFSLSYFGLLIFGLFHRLTSV